MDVVAGGDGTDTLSIVDTAAFAGFAGASISGIETVSISSGGAVGALFVAGSSAGSSTAAVQQITKITPGTPVTGTSDTYTLSVGGVNYSVSVTGTGTAGAVTKADIGGALRTALTTILGDQVEFGTYASSTFTANGATDATDGFFFARSTVAGTALPSISAVGAASTQTVTVADSVANKVATGGIAVKQIETITFSDSGGGSTAATDLSNGDVVTVYIGGVKYAAALTPDSTGAFTNAALATQVASIINSALGAGTATAGGSVVTLTAPTAGTALPIITTSVSNATDFVDSYAVLTSNQAANAAAGTPTSASSVGAPTGATSMTVSATGVANVTGNTTAALTVSGTSVQTSSGTDVGITASGSVLSTGAKGAVTISATDAGGTSAVSVLSNSGTGNTATYAKGIYVTGGTTVSISTSAASVSSGVASARTAPNIEVGVNPTEVLSGTAGANSNGAIKSTGQDLYNTIGGLASNPTGDVTITNRTTYTSSATGTPASVAYGTAAPTVYMNGGTTANLTGVTTAATVVDVNTTLTQTSASVPAAAGTSKLTTVNLTGVTAASGNSNLTLKSDVLANLRIVDSTGGNTSNRVVIDNSGTVGANSGTFNLTIGNSTAAVQNNTATTLNVSTVKSAYASLDGTAPVLNRSDLLLYASKATSLNINNADSLTINDSTGLAAVTKITLTGSGSVDLKSVATGWDKLSSIDGASASGGITVSLGRTPLEDGLVVRTGSGNDSITLTDDVGNRAATAGGNVATTISMGAGNDTLLKSGSGAVTAGASVDGGDGVDSVDITLVSAGNAAFFRNFERVELSNAGASQTLDAQLLSNSSIAGVTIGAAQTNAATVTNLSGTSVNVTVNPTMTVNTTVAGGTFRLADATGTADTANINFAGVAVGDGSAVLSATVTAVNVRGIETANVSSGGAGLNTSNFKAQAVANTLALFEDAGNTTSSLVVTGSNQFSLGTVSVTRSTSAGTVGQITAATFTTDGIKQNDVMATAPADDVAGALKSIDASATTGGVNLYAGTSDAIGTNGNSKNTVYTGLSITGGSGNDAIRNDAKGGTINGGAGDDWLVSGGAGQTLTGGAGSDRLVTTNGSIGVVLTGGEGTDTFDVTAAAFGASSTTSAAAVVVTVADLSAGDKIVGLTKTDGLFGAKVSLSTATSLDTAITEALTGVSAATTVWFQYGGNTYLVESSDNALGSGDTVVKLSGLVDLSTSTVASNVITFG